MTIRQAAYRGGMHWDDFDHLRTGGGESEGHSEPRDLTGTPAHQKLREFIRSQPPAARPDEKPGPVVQLERTGYERRQAAQGKPMILRRTIEPGQEAWLEAFIRANVPDEALEGWRKSNNVHHKSFSRIVREIRRRIEEDNPSAMAEQLQQMLDAAEEAQGAAPADKESVPPLAEAAEWATLDGEVEPEETGFEMQPRPLPLIRDVAVMRAAPAVVQPQPAGLDQVMEWLGRIRAMRDELAELGVTVEGSLSITIDL